MPSRNPLEIPEITAHVVSYLCDEDLASCFRVSKSWRDIFLPYRWRDVTRVMYNFGNSFSHIGPSQEALNKHHHLVQNLVLKGYYRDDNMCLLPNLCHLKIYHVSCGFGIYTSRKIFTWDLTGLSPLLDRLVVSNLNMDRGSCQRLLEHPRLRSLELLGATIMPDARQEIWRAFKNLESLSMSCISFRGKCPPIPADAVFNRLRTLVMENVRDLSHSQQLSMVLCCPSLKYFELKTHSFKLRMLIKHPVQKDRWSQLDNLNIPSSPKDEQWASILERIGNCFENVTCLHLDKGEFGPRSVKILGPHFSNLVGLRLTSCNSSVITDVLCSCPMLEILHVPDIFANDIAEGGHWVCQQLLELKMRIRVKGREQYLQPLVFERLSTLVRLTTLDMNCTNGDNGEGLLEFRLDCGLGQLASLQELRTVVFYNGYTLKPWQQLEMKDVEWMIGSWKKLKGIHGGLNRDPDVNAQLKDLLGKHGISHG